MGVDDGPYIRGSEYTGIIMTIWRLDGYLDGVLASRITTDGDDSAAVIGDALVGSRFRDQVRCIISDGGCLGGFNVLDMDQLNGITSLPVITASDEGPDPASFEKALMASGLDREIRLRAIGAHPPFALDLPDGICYVRSCGLTDSEAGSVVRRCILRGRMPEPVRIAHMIASSMGGPGVA